MPSFDVVCKPDQVELRNAVDQTNREVGTRFDFKGSDARIESSENTLTLYADSDFQLNQLKDILINKMARRNVDVRFLDYGKVEKTGGDKVKQEVTVRNGIPQEHAKKIVALIKGTKMKLQASIQGDSVRVQGAKKDDLQAAIAMLRKSVEDLPLSFENFRN